MTQRRPLCAALLLAAVLATATEAQQGTDRMVISSDPQLAELAGPLLAELAERSGLTLREPVRIERRTRAQLSRYLQAKLDEELPVEEARATVDAYALLGLVPPDLDLRELLLGLYTEQVAGFYEPDSTALFVMDDQSPSDLEALLLHELVHALQDQHADLSALTGPDVQSDRAAAAQAAIEGHATLVMMEFMAEQMMGMRLDLAQLPGFIDQMRPALEATRSQFPALANAPRLIQESMLFPYLEGTGFVQSLWSTGERVAPFGAHLPLSTEQVIDHDLSDSPVELALDVSGATVVDEDVLGRLAIDVLLREKLGPTGAELGEGWEGDHYALVEPSNGRRGLVWYVLWDDAGARERFAAALRERLATFRGPATLETEEVGGHPATVLRVAVPANVGVRARIVDAP